MSTKSQKIKKDLIEAMQKCKCIVTDACKMVGITRKTYYEYYKKDPEFKEAVDDLADTALDFAESKLFEKMNGVTMGKATDQGIKVYDVPPSDTALIFYLKTKGKSRGYIERTEFSGSINHSGSIDHEHKVRQEQTEKAEEVWKSLTPQERKDYTELTIKMHALKQGAEGNQN